MIQYATIPDPTPSFLPARNDLAWPCDREAVRFQVLSQPDHRGLRKIRVLFWDDGRRKVREQTASLDALIASARRRSVAFDVVEIEQDAEAA